LKQAQANERIYGAEKDLVMKWCLVSSILVLGATALVAKVDSEGGSKEAVWCTDYGDARVAARQSGKPLLVVFR
jgi:hypothetical protein